MEDVAAGHRQLALELGRRERLKARRPVRVAPQAVLQRLVEHRLDRLKHGGERSALGVVVIGGEQPRGHVQREHRQRVRAGGAQLR